MSSTASYSEMRNNKVSIITIGDELLIGQVIDTNSAYMAQQLGQNGFTVVRRVAVGDVWKDIWQALDEEQSHADIVLITGGLGPTADDITKPLLCRYFDTTLVQNAEALKNVTYLFEQVFKKPLTERNIKQADVPASCTVFQNKLGTAPGMCFQRHHKIFISMPGVPHEMQGMMEHDAIPYLLKHCQISPIRHRTLITWGIGESSLADLIQEFETALPPEIKLAYLPHFGMVRLRLSTANEKFAPIIDKYFEQLQQLTAEYLVSINDEPVEAMVGKLLLQQQKTIATAESCTGGLIAHLLSAVPGASAYLKGAVVSYANEIKQNLLKVSDESLEQQGAVSEAVVLQMLKGALESLQSDYALAVSGIMGPQGGSAEKPVGTVWIAVGNREVQQTKRLHFRFDRKRNTQLTALNALFLMRAFIADNKHSFTNP